MSSISITCSDLSFAWPDGSAVFDGLSFAVGAGRSALVARNGVGKSTLLRLIAGELAPTRGSVQVSGRLAYLPQDFALAVDRRVDEVLGIAGARAALRAIERGDVREERSAAVRDDWAVEERARATLDRLGLPHVGLDRRVGQLSGGESVLLGLAARFLWRPDVLLLDEPTNNLDLQRPAADHGAGVVPGRDDGGQPRRAVPARGRRHPLAPAGTAADRDRPAVSTTASTSRESLYDQRRSARRRVRQDP